MGRKSREKGKFVKEKKGFSKKIAMVIFPIFLIGALLSFLVAHSYLSWENPLIPKVLVRLTDVTITFIPFAPKTPKQIFSRVIFEMGNVKSGEHNFSFELFEQSEKPGTGLKKILAYPKVSGFFKKEGGQIDISGSLSPGFLSAVKNPSEVDFIEVDDYLYLKVKNLPSFQNLNFEKLGSGWHKIDIAKVKQDAKADIRTDEEIEKAVREKANLLFDLLSSKNLNKKISREREEYVSGKLSSHYKIELGEDDTKDAVRLFTSEDEGLGALKQISFELWVDKSKYYINKLQIDGALSKNLLSSEETTLSPSLGFTLVYELKRANENAPIKVPDEAEELSNILDLYLLVHGEGGGKNPTSQIFGAVSGLGDFGANLLTVERLMHVLYLAPTSL